MTELPENLKIKAVIKTSNYFISFVVFVIFSLKYSFF